jgi:uncharacterized integral membrane protein
MEMEKVLLLCVIMGIILALAARPVRQLRTRRADRTDRRRS